MAEGEQTCMQEPHHWKDKIIPPQRITTVKLVESQASKVEIVFEMLALLPTSLTGDQRNGGCATREEFKSIMVVEGHAWQAW
jgi:hypothetical protein